MPEIFKGAQGHLAMNGKNGKEYKETFSGLKKKKIVLYFFWSDVWVFFILRKVT